ncbi:ferritin family protein [Bacillus sp. DJP31]|uniref:ferritin family protein n=1 Tax=Bacillus sp. DJP31 TaxID=3409789 RepID=UPI003BB52B43
MDNEKRFEERVNRVLDQIIAGRNKFNEVSCSAGLPYPSIRFKKDPKQAQILLDLYAGAISEFTAVNSFRYQFLEAEPENPVFSRLLKCVTLNEEFHVRTLARLIDRLGGNPKYYNSEKEFWDGSLAIYGTGVRDRLMGDIEAEKGIIQLYEETVDKLTDPEVISLVERLGLDDVFHLELFQEALKRFENGEFR